MKREKRTAQNRSTVAQWGDRGRDGRMKKTKEDKQFKKEGDNLATVSL